MTTFYFRVCMVFRDDQEGFQTAGEVAQKIEDTLQERAGEGVDVIVFNLNPATPERVADGA